MTKRSLIVMTIAATLLTGCARTAPVHNVDQSLNQRYSDSEMKTAIIEAGLGRKWIMTPVAPGVINGRYAQREFVANIRVTYTAQSYSIQYVSSQNLKASNGKIHANYNRWVNNLDQDIQLRLAAQALK
ncbi:hypothetical protein [Pantoea sp. Z09]|uniref:hypothetical protein n=1 Tax=Pantoea sp. Z09 TaxID=2886821 RepID=UPI001EFDD4EF|nr:hypothetical protein [Pantoea sp. Z09]